MQPFPTWLGTFLRLKMKTWKFKGEKVCARKMDFLKKKLHNVCSNWRSLDDDKRAVFFRLAFNPAKMKRPWKWEKKKREFGGEEGDDVEIMSVSAVLRQWLIKQKKETRNNWNWRWVRLRHQNMKVIKRQQMAPIECCYTIIISLVDSFTWQMVHARQQVHPSQIDERSGVF